MNGITPAIIGLLFVLSCARINQESRDEYNAERKFRHGIIPLESKSTKNDRIILRLSDKLDQASVNRGKSIYVNHCLSCHGVEGLGNGPEASKQAHKPANLQNVAREVSNFKFFMSISQWQGDMPGWKDPFTDVDRDDLVSYIRSLR